MSVKEIADQADMIVAGINDGRAEGKAEGKAESIKNLMSTMNVSIDQAMDILKTPPEEHQYFKDLLAKEQ